MIQFELDEAKAVVTVEPQGKLEATDFDKLAETVDAFIAAKGPLAGLLIHARQFPGWKDFAGFLAHLRFVREHAKFIARVAIVADGDIATVAPKLAGAFVSAEVRHFDYDDLPAARAWVES